MDYEYYKRCIIMITTDPYEWNLSGKHSGCGRVGKGFVLIDQYTWNTQGGKD